MGFLGRHRGYSVQFVHMLTMTPTILSAFAWPMFIIMPVSMDWFVYVESLQVIWSEQTPVLYQYLFL